LNRSWSQANSHFLDLAGGTIHAESEGAIGPIIQSLLTGICFKLASFPSAGLLGIAVVILAITRLIAER
jgi:hypothetical protein